MSTSKKIKVGFIGCGDVAELHHQGLLNCENAELVGIYDVNTQIMMKREQQWGVKSFASFEALLNEEIQAVFVLTPIKSHHANVITALHAGKHVLVEKPVANEIKEIEEMAAVAASEGLQCMPGHNYIYSPEMCRLKKNIENGNLGKIAVSWILYHIHHNEKLCARYPGIIRQIGTHLLYTHRYLLGEAVIASAVTTRCMYPHLERDDQVMLTLTMPDGSLSNLFASFAVSDESSNPWSFVVKVLGSQGSVQLSWQDVVFSRALGTLTRSYGRYEETYEHEIDYFINQCVLNNKAPLSTLHDAISVLKMVIQAEQYSQKQKAHI